MDFGEIFVWLKKGQRIRRAAWGTRYIFLMPEVTMQSEDMPVARENFLTKAKTVTLGSFIMQRANDGTFIPWQANNEDIVAKDWQTAEE